MKKQIKILVAFSIFIGLFTYSATQFANAQSGGFDETCGSIDTPYYDASTLKPETGTYIIYGKLGRTGQSAKTSLHIQDQESFNCIKVGDSTLSGDKWTKIGTWKYTLSDSTPIFQLSSDSFYNLPTANRPSIMLVSKSNPVCTPKTNCSVRYGDETGSLIPTGTLLNEDTLHVVNARDITSDKIDEVNYFVDNKFVYTTPTQERFNMRYVPGGKHTLTRAIKFESAQQLIIEDKVEKSFANDFFDSIYRFFAGNSLFYKILGAILIIFSIFGIIVAISRHSHKKRLWRIEHGLEKADISHTDPSALKQFMEKEAKYIHLSKLIIWGCFGGIMVIACLIFINAHLLQLFRVNGVSMETTFQTDDQILVNKMRKSWAKLSNGEYVPNRGEVIVFHKAKSQFLIAEGDNEETYVVKRVLGLPGERIVVKKGIITIYNKDNPKGFKPDQNSSWEQNLTIDKSENIDVKLSQSQIFVAGENRPESIDSRANGAVEVNEIVGQATFRVLPLPKFTKL